ncbi:hypothetical protein EDB89DRAFT_1907092 [Lactarius sanguifluus]|nr:hypothetical protein EDB89DRAFT_1907092 [Lactarius sanguifluus]
MTPIYDLPTATKRRNRHIVPLLVGNAGNVHVISLPNLNNQTGLRVSGHIYLLLPSKKTTGSALCSRFTFPHNPASLNSDPGAHMSPRYSLTLYLRISFRSLPHHGFFSPSSRVATRTGNFVPKMIVGPIAPEEITTEDYRILQDYKLAKGVSVLNALGGIVPAFEGYDRAAAADTIAMPYRPHALQATISGYRGGNKNQVVAALSAGRPVERLATEGVAINSNKPDDRRAYPSVRERIPEDLKDVIKMSLNVGPTWFCDTTKAVGIVQMYGEGGTHCSQPVIDKITCTSDGPGGSRKLLDWHKTWEADHPV